MFKSIWQARMNTDAHYFDLDHFDLYKIEYRQHSGFGRPTHSQKYDEGMKDFVNLTLWNDQDISDSQPVVLLPQGVLQNIIQSFVQSFSIRVIVQWKGCQWPRTHKSQINDSFVLSRGSLWVCFGMPYITFWLELVRQEIKY